jgi:hypothetical protein
VYEGRRKGGREEGRRTHTKESMEGKMEYMQQERKERTKEVYLRLSEAH